MKAPFPHIDPQEAIKEFGDGGAALIKGMQNLAQIGEIDVGTAPKELVYQEDKLTLYHYSRATEATWGSSPGPERPAKDWEESSGPAGPARRRPGPVSTRRPRSPVSSADSQEQEEGRSKGSRSWA